MLVFIGVAFSLYTCGPAAAEKIVLKVTDWQAGCALSIINANKEMMQIFEQTHPGVKIDYIQYTYPTYGEFLLPAIAAGIAPDIFAVYPGGPLAKLVRSAPENLVCLSDVMDEEWKSWLGKAYYFNGARVDGKLWVAPQDAQTECIWIHKDMFEACGMKVPPLAQPMTVDELISLVEPAKQLGYDVLTAGFLEFWCVIDPFFNMAHQLQPSDTPDMVMQALNGEISWQQDIFRLPVEAFKKLHDAHVWPEDAVNMDYQTQASAKWLDRKAIGLWANGDWYIGMINESIPKENTPDNPNIVTLMYPLVNKDATPAYNQNFGMDFGVYGKGKHKDLAIAFVRFTNSPEAQKIRLRYGNVPVAAGAVDIASLEPSGNPIFDECVELFTGVKGRASEYYYTQVEPLDLLGAGIVNVMIGQDTIDNLLSELDKACGYKG